VSTQTFGGDAGEHQVSDALAAHRLLEIFGVDRALAGHIDDGGSDEALGLTVGSGRVGSGGYLPGTEPEELALEEAAVGVGEGRLRSADRIAFGNSIDGLLAVGRRAFSRVFNRARRSSADCLASTSLLLPARMSDLHRNAR